MKCYTNESNPISLKLLISSKLGGQPLQLQYVTEEERKNVVFHRLPIIESNSGVKIFSSNAAARYLFKPSSEVAENVDLWLEWEFSVLQPALKTLNLDKFDIITALSAIDHLENSLHSKSYLVGDEISLADVAVWSSLYGILSEPALVTQYFAQKRNVVDWFARIKALKEVDVALQTWGSKAGAEVFRVLLETQWYPSSRITENVKNVPEEEARERISPEELENVKKTWSSLSRPKPKVPTFPVLPSVDEKNILITSALPYVNNVPHLGNIIGCVLSADVFARYCRLRNWNTLYIAGTDEYGTATETKALEENLTPQQICDKYFVIHKEAYSWFNISFDYFGRTTTAQQKSITQEFFMDIYNNKFTSVASVEQLHCETCNRFLADRFVEGICPNCKFEDARGDQCDGCGHLINAIELINPRCKLCSKMPVVRNSEHIFFELPKIEPVLRDWIQKASPNWTHNARSITETWLKDGLKPRCITRDLKWGTPVPLAGFENKVFYVWFDAPFGYVSITACYTDQWRKWWQPSKETPVTYYEFMAKDNVPFHSVMFPATLLAINKGYLLVDSIMATEYLNYEDTKFSKSRGVGVFGTDAKSTGLPADVFRFYLLYVRPESQDSSFSWVDLATKHNSELLNNIGNFVNRALMFTEKYFDSVIPAMNLETDDFTLLALVARELNSYNAALEKAKLRDGIKLILNISRHGNQYMQNQKPWVLVKGSPEEKSRAGTVIGVSSNIACLIAIAIQPYMPNISAIMRKQLNVSDDVLVLTDEVNMLLQPGHKIGKPTPIFTKIELNVVESLKKQFSGREKSSSPVNNVKKSPAISFSNLPSQSKNTKCLQEMEAAIAKQGDLVRNMKSSGIEKSQWMPHVEVLKDMKKQYEELKKAVENMVPNDSTSKEIENGFSNDDKETEILRLEDAIQKQGDKIRSLKSKGEGKNVWGSLVTELLELKKQLAKLKPVPEVVKKGNKK